MLSRAMVTRLSIALPIVLLAGELAAMAPQVLPDMKLFAPSSGPAVSAPATTTIAPGSFDYRLSGAFLRDSNPVDGPIEAKIIPDSLALTTTQITAAAYALCVDDGACEPVKQMSSRPDLPAVGVSFDDAIAYADWLSARTGSVWRLPTDAEWAFAAGSRFRDDALGIDENAANPALRWLAAYRTSADRAPPSGPQPLGAFGTNENGLSDMSGNVWEWTSSCYERTTLGIDGSVKSIITNCGVRIAEGIHRAYISRFVRDAKAGGCSAGTPPELLGFRLVRETNWWAPPLRAVGTLLGKAMG